MSREEALARRAEARDRLISVTDMMGPSPEEAILRTALPELQAIVEHDPRYADALWHVASVHESLGDLRRAGEHYAAVVRLDPELGGNSESACVVYGRLAQLHEMSGRPVEALRYYNRFLGYYPLSPQAKGMAQRIDMMAECGGDWLGLLQAACQVPDDQLEQALASLAEALLCYPTATCLHKRMGLVLRKLGRYDEAVRAFEEASKYDHDARLYMEMGITFGDVGNPYVEEGFYARALELSPHDALALFNMGVAFYGRRDRGQALEFLERAVDISPEADWAERACEIIGDLSRSGVHTLPDCLREPVAWERWKDETEGLSLIYPNGAAVLPRTDADDLFAFASDPQSEVFEFRLRRRQTYDSFDLEQHARLIDYRLTHDTSQKVEARDTLRLGTFTAHVWDARNLQTDMMQILGMFHREDVRYELCTTIPWVVYVRVRNTFHHIIRNVSILPARECDLGRKRHYESILARAGDNVNALAGLGATLVKLGSLEEAQKAYTRLLQVDPNNPQALGDLGLFYWQQDKVDRAIQALMKSLGFKPDMEYARVLGLCYERKGQPDKAARTYLDALARKPDRQLRMQLAVAYERMKKTDLAEKEYRQLLEDDPYDVRVRMLMGAFYRCTGRLSEAIGAYREAVQLDARSVDGHLMLATCLYEQKSFDMAEKSYRKALSLDPSNQAARDGIDQLSVERKKGRKY